MEKVKVGDIVKFVVNGETLTDIVTWVDSDCIEGEVYLLTGQKLEIIESAQDNNIEKIIENADPSKVLDAMAKVLRRNNAEKFIDSLNQNFSETQRENFIKVLCDYESFLNNNDLTEEINNPWSES